MAKRKAPSGAGTIRKKTAKHNGKTYTYFEARYTDSYDPETGKQRQRSITGKTQKEVAEKLRSVTASIDAGTYIEPNKMTVGQWLDIWAGDYLCNVKEGTVYAYKAIIRLHIKPYFGTVRLSELTPHMVQRFYNELAASLSAKTVKNIHGVLHAALDQAVLNKYLLHNPTAACKLPKVIRKEMHILEDELIGAFVEAIQGERFEGVFYTALFTGMRKGEVLGLTWDCVDFVRGTVLVNKQLQRPREGDGTCKLAATKNGKSRRLTPARAVIAMLKQVKAKQLEWQLLHGPYFQNPMNLVFTNELGEYLNPNTVYNDYKKVVEKLGVPELRFHDLRHTYAVASIMAGDDMKTVQENLGHATASFTLDVYGHVTEQMKRDSADRIDRFIRQMSKRSS